MASNDPSDAGDEPRAASARDVGLIDVHCHLLPGLDDGCRNLRESLECARRLVAAGFTHAFCTPQVGQDLPHNNLENVQRAVTELQAALDAGGIPLVLFPGGDMRLGREALDAPPDDLLLMNLGESRGGRFILFDAPGADWPDYLDPTVMRLTQLGITPIMAHPERSEFFYDDPLEAADRLAELGVLFQLNCYMLDEKALERGLYTKPMRAAAERLIEFDYYSFLATDLHRAETLDERLGGLEAARSVLEPETFDRLTHRNPIQLLPE